MVSPLGPTLSNSFLCYHEKKVWLDKCPEEFKPVFFTGIMWTIFCTLQRGRTP